MRKVKSNSQLWLTMIDCVQETIPKTWLPLRYFCYEKPLLKREGISAVVKEPEKEPKPEKEPQPEKEPAED